MQPEDVLSFWFGELDAEGLSSAPVAERWWRKDAGFDAEITKRFGPTLEALLRGEHNDWLGAPRSWLAYVIVLDQFSRNIFRGSGRSFAADPRALQVAERGISQGFDRSLRGVERVFAYMPLMHSEALATQDRCVSLFSAYRDESHGALRELVENNVGFAIRHRDVIASWGRFPHRNELLGRASSEEELAFLKQPGSSF